MRTTNLKIGTETKDAILIAGGQNFKVYYVSSFDGWILKINRKVHTFKTGSLDFKSISRYVNIKYNPTSEHGEIKNTFKEVVSRLNIKE